MTRLNVNNFWVWVLLLCLGVKLIAHAQGNVEPTLDTPVAGSSLNGASQSFSWSENDVNVQNW